MMAEGGWMSHRSSPTVLIWPMQRKRISSWRRRQLLGDIAQVSWGGGTITRVTADFHGAPDWGFAAGARPADSVVVGFIGSGNYASQVLIPAFKGTPAILKSVASAKGVSGVHAGKKYGFQETTTDSEAVLRDAEVNTVVVATRHDSHAQYVCHALRARKHVFVEKPLAITRQGLEEIEKVFHEMNAPQAGPAAAGVGVGALLLMVGFNRRFAPQVQKVSLLTGWENQNHL
jgi:hypothetical protein